MATSAAASTAIGWYGPLINLADTGNYVDQFVQLLVFVHSSQSIQRRNGANKEGILKTKILVGDGTRTYFPVSVWPKKMGNAVSAGDIILLQNVKIIKFWDILEAATLQVSTVLIVAHSNVLNSSRAVDDLLSNAKLGKTAKQKLKKVIDWVKHTESAFEHVQQENLCQKRLKNWKEDEEKLEDFSSISEILALTRACNAKFCASVGELLLPAWRYEGIRKEESLFFRKLDRIDNKILEDLVCMGCKNCGNPMGSRNLIEENRIPLYCQKSSKYVHNYGPIYRPFMVQVSDHTGEIPILIMNKAAEILFGNLVAENVYCSYQEGMPNHSSHVNMQDKVCQAKNRLDLYQIWLIVIKMLFRRDQNSPFCFNVIVNPEKNIEFGRLELISMTMPCVGNSFDLQTAVAET